MNGGKIRISNKEQRKMHSGRYVCEGEECVCVCVRSESATQPHRVRGRERLRQSEQTVSLCLHVVSLFSPLPPLSLLSPVRRREGACVCADQRGQHVRSAAGKLTGWVPRGRQVSE